MNHFENPLNYVIKNILVIHSIHVNFIIIINHLIYTILIILT